jgi:type II secretory pathway pseudopilin PulG
MMRNQSGFSYAELLAAMTLFSVVAAGLTTNTVATMRSNGMSRGATAAAALLNDKIEQFRAMDPATNPADLTAGYHADPNNPMTPLGHRGGNMNRSWMVAANSPKVGLSEVVVTVTWSDPLPRRLTAVTYVCRTATCG